LQKISGASRNFVGGVVFLTGIPPENNRVSKEKQPPVAKPEHAPSKAAGGLF